MFPKGLVGTPYRGAFICGEWELRVTGRCLKEDLGRDPESEFERLLGIDIVKEFVHARRERTTDRKLISGLKLDLPVWVLSRGHDHRGATLFDEEERVVWLVAYGRHRSGRSDDFYAACPDLAAAGRLLPAEIDYERMFDDRGERFVDSLNIEAPLILKAARESGNEVTVTLGGHLGARVAVEIAGEAEATYLAIDLESLDGDLVSLALAAFHTNVEDWENAERMPSRELRASEAAFIHVHQSGGPG